MSVNVKRRLIKKSKLFGSDEEPPRKIKHTESDEKLRSNSVESSKSVENKLVQNDDDFLVRQKLLQELNDDVMIPEEPKKQKNNNSSIQMNDQSDSSSSSLQEIEQKKKKNQKGEKAKKSKRVLEKNEALLQKLKEKNDIFNQEEETDEEFNERALNVLKYLEDKQVYKKHKSEGNNMTRPKKDTNRIDIKNKLFSDINPIDINRSDDDEPIKEEQVITSGKLIIEDQKKLKKNLSQSFMNSIALFKQERGLCGPSQPLNEVQNIISVEQPILQNQEDNNQIIDIIKQDNNSQQMGNSQQFNSSKVSESDKQRLQSFLDQNSINQNDDEIEIQIKEFNQENSMTNNTIFINKLSRTLSENGLIARSLNNQIILSKDESKNSQIKRGKKISRDEYYKSILDEVKLTRQKTLSVQQIKDLFQTKDFDILQNQINKKVKSKEAKEVKLGQDVQFVDEDSKEDEDYNPDQDHDEEQEIKNLQDDNIEIEEKDPIQHLQEIEKSQNDNKTEEILDVDQEIDIKNDDQIQQEISIHSQEKSPYRVNDDDVEEDEEDNIKMPLKRLKNIQRELLYKKNLRKNLKEQEKLERQRKIIEKKQQRERELEEHPELREIQQKLLENEADQGSDNEEHDDVVKAIDYEKELQEEGLQGLDLDQDVENLINNYVDYDEENEQIAYNQYFKDLQKEDQELIKRVIAGRFKSRNQRRNNMYLEDHLNEEDDHKKRLKRIDDQIKLLQQNEEDAIAAGQANNHTTSEVKEDDELKSCQLKQLLYLKKKELEKMSQQNQQEDIQHISNISQQVLEWVQKQQVNKNNLSNAPTTSKKVIVPKRVGMDILDPNIQLNQKSSFLGVKNNVKTISQFTIGEHINEIATNSLSQIQQVNENSLSSKMFNSFSKLISNKEKEIAPPKVKSLQRQSSGISAGSGQGSNMSSSLNKFFGQHTLLSGRSPNKIISFNQKQKIQK